MPVGVPEFADNPEPRCPVVLLLDTSKSMSGDPIDALNAGLKRFKEAVSDDPTATLRVEVAIVAFGKSVRKMHDFKTIDQFEPPTLIAEGRTPMGEAINMALDELENRKSEYKANDILYYRPWVFLLTDGAPTDEWDGAAKRVREGEDERKLSFFAVGVEGSDFETLTKIAPPNRPPRKLKGLEFNALFEWLSSSVSKVSEGEVGGQFIALPPADGWAETTT